MNKAKKERMKLRDIKPYVTLYRDPDTGIAWIEDGETGTGISVHPSIDDSGSLAGMRKLHWGDTAKVVRFRGFYYNLSSFVAQKDSKYDQIVANECRCEDCRIRRKAEQTIEVKRTSMTGQSIFVITDPSRDRMNPIVSIQLPTEVALWLKAAAEERKDSYDDFVGQTAN